jgi:hypothetical protein
MAKASTSGSGVGNARQEVAISIAMIRQNERIAGVTGKKCMMFFSNIGFDCDPQGISKVHSVFNPQMVLLANGIIIADWLGQGTL